MKDLVEYIARKLVEHPDQVEVTSTEAEGMLNLTLKVADSDKGKVIGKGGKVIKAIRALVGVSCEKAGTKAAVEVA